jgi:hypothetical protein
VCYRSVTMQPTLPTPLVNLYDLPRAALGELLTGWGYSAYHRDLLWEALYRQQVESFDALTGLRPDLVQALRERTRLERPTTHHGAAESTSMPAEASSRPPWSARSALRGPPCPDGLTFTVGCRASAHRPPSAMSPSRKGQDGGRLRSRTAGTVSFRPQPRCRSAMR